MTDLVDEVQLRTAEEAKTVSAFTNDVENLYAYRDELFKPNSKATESSKNRYKLIRTRLEQILSNYNEIEEQIRDPCQRALFSYWKGRAFNIFPEYDKRATDYLSKAALLQPSNVLTLNELGESYAKNGEYEMAANCFKNANSKEKNRAVLRNLSIVTRQLASKVTDRAERNRMIEESIQYAKQAVEIDVKDGASWYTLANSYVCFYFMVENHPKNLKQAFSAYNLALKDPASENDGDLHYSRGVALQYHEDYAEALAAYEHALELDSENEDARNNQDQLLSYLRTITDLLACKGRIKPKKFKTLISILNETPPFSNNIVPLQFLHPGENENGTYRGTVVASLGVQDVKLMFILVDTEERCVLVTVYYVDISTSVSLGDIIEIPKPVYRLMDIEWRKEKFSIPSLRVDSPRNLKINGKDWPMNTYAPPAISLKKLANDHRSKTSNKKTDIALLNINRGLNRFRDVLPYDDTRVCLTKGTNDYINANYIEVPPANRKYILTQGPLESTASHFWQMIWEQNSRVIVMLTRLFEKGSPKCWLYYPDYQNASELLYDSVNLKVVFLSERPYRHYTERKFELIHLPTGESRVIIHWSDFEWPDHGAPSNPEPFLQLLRDVRHCGAFDLRYGAPILHCSAGIGRSGTFVFVDSILKMLAHTENPPDIRTQRSGLIQTAEQLRFSYRAIIAGLEILAELEQNERLYIECEGNLSSESDSDTEEQTLTDKKYPKQCGRQDNIMPNGRLSDSLEDINCELMRRADSNASSYHPSPKTTHRLISMAGSRVSSEDLKHYSQSVPLITPQDVETSLRLRQERLVRNEDLERKVNDLKTKFHRQSSYNEATLFSLLTTKYRRPFFIGVLTVLTGTFLLYKYAFSSNRNR
ncbi:hypothetical protein I4U23_031051 [Adineta vaga]|nr:hypothetical protein I4U23_031051 [Adineta vaga]